MKFGTYIRRSRESRKRLDARYSLRQVARRIGVEPAYLSKVERNEVAPPSEAKIRRLAAELDEDGDALLSMAGKVAGDLQRIIRARPLYFGPLLRKLDEAPDEYLAGLVFTESREGTQRYGRRGRKGNA